MTTSIANRNTAYHNHPNKVNQCEKVKELLISVPNGLTINEMSRILHLPASTISGRIGDLKPNVVECGSRVDVITGINVTVWKCVGSQGLLFNQEKQTPKKKLKKVKELCELFPCYLAKEIESII